MLNLKRGVILLIAFGIVFLLILSVVNQVQKDQPNFDANLKRSQDAQAHISQLTSAMGYSGFIHNFKNYVIRGNEDYYNKTVEQFLVIDGLLDQAKKRFSGDGFLRAIEDIRIVMSEYKTKLEVARRMKHQGASIREIDLAVHVDDTAAGEALKVLAQQYKEQSLTLLNQNQIYEQKYRQYLTLLVWSAVFIGSLSCFVGWFIASLYVREKDNTASVLLKNQLLDAVPNPSMVISEDGVVNIVNQGMGDLFEMDQSILVGQFLEDVSAKYFQGKNVITRQSLFDVREHNAIIKSLSVRASKGKVKNVDVHIGLYSIGEDRYAVANFVDVSQLDRLKLEAEALEKQFETTFELAPVGIALINTDRTFFRVNKQFCGILGYSQYEIEGMSYDQIAQGDDLDASGFALQKVMNGELDYVRLEKCYLHKSGSKVWARLTMALCRIPRGTPKYLVGIIEDISQTKKFESDLLESEFKLKTIANHVNGVVWMSTPGVENVLFVSGQFERVWGGLSASLKKNPKSFFDSVIEADRDHVYHELDNHRKGQWSVRYRIRDVNGHIRHIFDEGTPVFDESGLPRYIVALARDVTYEHEYNKRLENTNQRLEILAKYDPLTMSIRRQYAVMDMDECIAHFKRYGTDASVIFVDLDEFKIINDTYGHEFGDQVLIEFSNVVRENIRETDGFYRYAGDEFLILLRETSMPEAEKFVIKLEGARVVVNQDQLPPVQVKFSCGVSSLGEIASADSNEWIIHADKAMYARKNQRKELKKVDAS